MTRQLPSTCRVEIHELFNESIKIEKPWPFDLHDATERSAQMHLSGLVSLLG